MAKSRKETQAVYFDVYAANLSAMHHAWPEFHRYSDTFMCPICLKHFKRSDIEADLLSVEDCIPRALGGSIDTTTLTCKKCNNDDGSDLDAHLVKRFQMDAFQAGLSNQQHSGRFEVAGATVNALFRREPDKGNLEVTVHQKSNNPQYLKALMDKIRQKNNAESTPVAFHIKTRFHPVNAYVALLRAGYLMMFRQFGYGYIMNMALDPVREQILQPEKELLPQVYVLDLGKNPVFKNTIVGVKNPPEFRVLISAMTFSVDGWTAHKGVVFPYMGEDVTTLYARIPEIGQNGQRFGGRQWIQAEYSLERLRDPESVLIPLHLTEEIFQVN